MVFCRYKVEDVAEGDLISRGIVSNFSSLVDVTAKTKKSSRVENEPKRS